MGRVIIDPSRGQPFRPSQGILLDPGTGRPDAVAEAMQMTREERLYTLDEQVGFAARLHYGDAKALHRLHHKWREVGVLWRPDRRQSRRGGAGLWNRDQVRLWLECLRRRRDMGTQGHPRNLAALPVGLWLWGQPGIPLQHARSAFHTRWSAYLASPLADGKDARKSRKRRAIAAEAQRILSRNPGWRLLEELRGVEPLGDGKVEIPSKNEFIDTLVEQSARSPSEAHLIAQTAYWQIATAALALANLDRLCYCTDQDWPDMWKWGQRVIRQTWSNYATKGARLVPKDFYDPSANAFLQGADRNLLMVFGDGLNPNTNHQWPDGLPSPPTSLPGLRNASE